MKIKIKREMLPFLFIILGSLITVVSAYFDYRNKLKEKEEQLIGERKRSEEYKSIISASNEIILKNNSIMESQKEVIDTAQKIIDLQNELNQKNNEIQDLQSSTLNNITGGSNIPCLYVSADTKLILVQIFNRGDYPLRNLMIRFSRTIYDYMQRDKDGNMSSNNPEVHKILILL